MNWLLFISHLAHEKLIIDQFLLINLFIVSNSRMILWRYYIIILILFRYFFNGVSENLHWRCTHHNFGLQYGILFENSNVFVIVRWNGISVSFNFLIVIYCYTECRWRNIAVPKSSYNSMKTTSSSYACFCYFKSWMIYNSMNQLICCLQQDFAKALLRPWDVVAWPGKAWMCPVADTLQIKKWFSHRHDRYHSERFRCP